MFYTIKNQIEDFFTFFTIQLQLASNQEKALVEAFSVIVKLQTSRRLVSSSSLQSGYKHNCEGILFYQVLNQSRPNKDPIRLDQDVMITRIKMIRYSSRNITFWGLCWCMAVVHWTWNLIEDRIDAEVGSSKDPTNYQVPLH